MLPRVRKNVMELSSLRTYFSSSSVINSQEIQDAKQCPRPFEEIPGPRSLPILGTLYKYLPIIGEYSFNDLNATGLKKYQQFGPIVREEIVKGISTLWIFRPEDIAKIFQMDNTRYPQRRSHLALYKYRTDRKSIYNSGGLLPTNGEEWWRLRKEFQKGLSKPQNIINYLAEMDDIIKEFINYCKTQTNCNDFLPLLSRLYLQLICLVAFDVKLDCFTEEEMKNDSMSSKLINAAFTTNSTILKLDNGPRLWRYFDTPLYQKLVKSQSFMERIAVDMVSQKLREMSTNKQSNSLLEIYLRNPALDVKDVIGMACDMLLAGIDTTSYSTAFALYHLANNKKCQEKLQEEARLLLNDKNDTITVDVLKKAVYTKAVIKETFRLNPISVGVGRILQCDTVLSGYHVPKDVVVVTQNQVICRLPEYFKDPHAFIPERWLRNNENNVKTDPYLILPFGHGSRSCIARRLAEQNMQTFLLRFCRNFEFLWNGGLLNSKSFLINVPDSPITLQLQQSQ